MFDDIDTPQTGTVPQAPLPPQQPVTAARPRPIQPAPPSNLPVGAPFPEDIFSSTDVIPVVTSLEPQMPAQTPLQVIIPLGSAPPPSLGTPIPPIPFKENGQGPRKVIAFFLSALIVAFLGLGGYLVYRILKTRASVDVLNQPIEDSQDEPQEEPEEATDDGETEEITVNEPGSIEESIEEVKNVETEKEPEEKETPEEEPLSPPSDTDNDGLSDLEELELGSNPRIIDTDLDGLDDYSEARIYRSNPVRRDTDGDSYDDGVEVQNGYSPTGPGKLTSE